MCRSALVAVLLQIGTTSAEREAPRINKALSDDSSHCFTAVMTSYWTGTRVQLRGPEPDDWIEGKRVDEVTEDQRSGGQMWPPRSDASYRKGAEDQAVQSPDADAFSLAIVSVESGQLVGGISTHEGDKTAGAFSYGIMVGQAHQRRGYASEAVILVLGYMFGERRFQKCNVVCYSYNDASIALQRKLGFTEEGRIRRNRYFAGRYYDDVLFGITIEEYAERFPFPSI